MYIIKINVEFRNEIYYTGTFETESEARHYIDLHHGDLDLCEIIQLKKGI